MNSKTKILTGVLLIGILIVGWWVLTQKNAENEEIKTDKIDSYLKYLMSSKGLQGEYLVDIEFSHELSSSEIAEIEKEYSLKFSRLPDSNIAHTSWYYGATVNGYTINKLIKRTDTIIIASAIRPVQIT